MVCPHVAVGLFGSIGSARRSLSAERAERGWMSDATVGAVVIEGLRIRLALVER